MLNLIARENMAT